MKKTLSKPSRASRVAFANTALRGMGIDPTRLALPFYNGAATPSGQICLPNESLFTQDHFSEPLTTYATGWRDPSNIEALMDFIAPPVEVGRRFEFKQAENAEEFIIDSDDIRAVGASFKEVTYTSNTVNAKTLNKGLTIRLDIDQYTDVTKAQQTLTAKLLRRLKRSEYARCLAILAAAATNTAVTWSTGTPNPMADHRTALLAGQVTSGMWNNRIWWANDAWVNQQAGFEAGGTTSAGFRYADKNPDEIAKLLLCDSGMVSNAVYQSSASGKSRLGAGLVFQFFAEDGVDVEDATHLKRFWSATESGPIRVYSQVFAKFIEVTVEHYSLPVATTTLGVRALTVS
jgi:hypothetical protein